MTPAEELKAAAFLLRNPFHQPGLKTVVDTDLVEPLAEWMEYEANFLERVADVHGVQTERAVHNCRHSLAVARVINGGQSPAEVTTLRVGSKASCHHCGEEIIWEPWFRDGRGPNPPVWSHTRSGTRSCSTEPADWTGDRWPFAEPQPDGTQP
ncbi:hypothetical protein [Streptomyces virginiae]